MPFGPGTQAFTKFLLIVYNQKDFYIKEPGNVLSPVELGQEL